MKFHQEPTLKSNNGTNIGDQVLFSSHNPKNTDLNCDITLNKLYTIFGMREDGESCFLDDVGEQNWAGNGSKDALGQYDIIIRSTVIDPEFKPVTLTLETIEEVKLFSTLIGHTSPYTRRQIMGTDDMNDGIGEIFDKLDDIAPHSDVIGSIRVK